VLAIETVALLVVALVVAGYLLAGHHPHDVLDAWVVVGFAIAGALGVGVVARGFWRRRRWSRAPAVLIQLLTLPVGVNTIGNGVWWVAVPLLACGVAGLVGLFAPTTTRALFGPAPSR
jgi:hypothetical protein